MKKKKGPALQLAPCLLRHRVLFKEARETVLLPCLILPSWHFCSSYLPHLSQSTDLSPFRERSRLEASTDHNSDAEVIAEFIMNSHVVSPFQRSDPSTALGLCSIISCRWQAGLRVIRGKIEAVRCGLRWMRERFQKESGKQDDLEEKA